jgi:hypothetical protein
MVDEQQPQKDQQESQTTPSGVGKPSIELGAFSKGADPKPAQQSQDGNEPAKPLLVQIVGGDALEPFEEQTLAISRRTYWVAIFAFLAALAAAIFVGTQVKIMSYQTQIMASQSESAVASATQGARDTREQLRIAQQQAKTAQDSVKAIQRQTIQELRPWIKFTMADPKITPTVSWYVHSGSPLTAPVMFINVGKTPAIRVEVIVGVDLIPRGQDPKLPVTYRHAHGRRAQPPFVRSAIRKINTGTIFPDGNVHDTVDRLELTNGKATKKLVTPAEVEAANAGNSYLVIFGIATYHDGFGIKRWTRFCRGQFVSGEDANNGKCANYNAVDNN